jgi:hypothetical protein
MTAIKKKTVNKSVVKKLATNKAPANKVAEKKAPSKKVPAKKTPTKKVSIKKTQLSNTKWNEGAVDVVKKSHNRLSKPYSVNICPTSSGTLFEGIKTLVEPKKEISKSKLQKFIEKAEKIIRKRYSNEPLKLSTFNELVQKEVDRMIEVYNTRKTIDEVLKDRFAPNPSGKREIKTDIDLSPTSIKLFCESIFKEKKDKENGYHSFNSPFKLKSNGKYNIGTIKGLKIINKDGYVPLKVLILTFDKDEIKLLKNGLPIKFILEK